MVGPGLTVREFRGADGVDRFAQESGFQFGRGIQADHGIRVEQRVEQRLVSRGRLGVGHRYTGETLV